MSLADWQVGFDSPQVERAVARARSRFYHMSRQQVADLVNPHGFEFDPRLGQEYWTVADAWAEYEWVLRNSLRKGAK